MSRHEKKNTGKKIKFFSPIYLQNQTDFSSFKTTYFKVFLKTSLTNLFVSLTDADYKLIICHSSGSSGLKVTSRRKKAPQAIESIIRKMHSYFIAHKIKEVELIINRRITKVVHYLIRELGIRGIRIACLRRRRIVAHNGVRRHKLPRK